MTLDWPSIEEYMKEKMKKKENYTILNLVNATHLEIFMSDKMMQYIAKKVLSCLEQHRKMPFSQPRYASLHLTALAKLYLSEKIDKDLKKTI